MAETLGASSLKMVNRRFCNLFAHATSSQALLLRQPVAGGAIERIPLRPGKCKVGGAAHLS